MTKAIVVRVEGDYVITAQGADLLSTLASQASDARDEAVSAAAAALAAAGLGEYPDTGAGLSGTTEGETFWVDLGDGAGQVYRHDPGPTATPLQKFIIDPTDSGAADIFAGGVPTTAALRSSTGGEMVGTSGGGTVQASLDNQAAALAAHTATRQMQRVIQKLRRGEPCNIVFAGDSTGALVDRWIYRAFDDYIAARYPAHTFDYRLVEEDGSGYEAPITIQTGTAGGSSPVCTIWNASVSGSASSRWAGQVGQSVLRPAVIGDDPDLIVFSYGHNGLYDYETQLASLAGVIGETLRTMPLVPIVVVGQNPVLTDDTMAVKVTAFRAAAAALGAGWLDVHEAFLEYPGDLADLYIDDVHPDTAGNILWATAFADAFRFDINGPSGSAVSNLNRGVFFAQHLYSDLSGWELFNCTIEEETTGGYYETGGSSLKITGNGAGGSAYARKLIIPSGDIQAYRNRLISVSARIRVEAADADGGFNGRIALYDGVATTITPNGGPAGDGFFSQSVTRKIDNASTGVYLYVYLHNTAPSTKTLRLDRVTGADGPIPRDSAIDVTGATQLSQTKGTFDPTLIATGTDFDAVSYHAIRAGGWVRTGDMIHFQIVMRTDSITMGSAAGQVALAGLPVAAINALHGYAAVTVTFADGFAGDVPISGRIDPNGTRINLFYRETVNGADKALEPTDLNTGAASNTMVLTGSYRVA